MKTWCDGCFSFLCLIVLLVASPANATVKLPLKSLPPVAERGLYFHITTDKSVYKRLESVYVTYWIENQSDEVQYYSYGDDQLDFEIYNQFGRPIRDCLIEMSEARTRQLDAKGRPLANYEVFPPAYSTRKRERELIWSFPYCYQLQAGIYYATYVGMSDTAWFEVTEPSNPLERHAIALYDSAISLTTRSRHASTKGESLCRTRIPTTRLLLQLLRDHGQIYFARAACQTLFDPVWSAPYQYKDSLTADEQRAIGSLAARYLRLYPYRSDAWAALFFLDPVLLDAQERNWVLEWWEIFDAAEINNSYGRSQAKPVIEKIEALNHQ